MRVAIVGAGAVGRSIARGLLEHGHQVLIIEKRRVSYRPDRVPDADWMLADASEVDVLRTAGVETCDVLMAATADDQTNLVVCMFAKTEFAVPRVVARVTNPNNEWLFTPAWGVDVSVSTRSAMVAGFEELVSTGAVVQLMTLQHGQADILEVKLPETTRFAGVSISALPLPEEAVVLAVVRNGVTSAARSDLVLQPSDLVLLAAGEAAQTAVRAALQEPSLR